MAYWPEEFWPADFWPEAFWPEAEGSSVPQEAVSPLPRALLREFRQRLVHRPLIGRDAYGQPQYGTPIRIQARLVPGHGVIRDAFGREQTPRHVGYLATTLVIGVEDQLTWPDGSTPPVLRVDRYEDPRLPHTRVLFG